MVDGWIDGWTCDLKRSRSNLTREKKTTTRDPLMSLTRIRNTERRPSNACAFQRILGLRVCSFCRRRCPKRRRRKRRERGMEESRSVVLKRRRLTTVVSRRRDEQVYRQPPRPVSVLALHHPEFPWRLLWHAPECLPKKDSRSPLR